MQHAWILTYCTDSLNFVILECLMHINNVFCWSFHAVWYCKDTYIYICTNWSGTIKVRENTRSPYRFFFTENESRHSPLVHDGHVMTILHSCYMRYWSDASVLGGHVWARPVFPVLLPNTDVPLWCSLWKTRCCFWVWSTRTTSVHTSTCIEKAESKGKKEVSPRPQTPLSCSHSSLGWT